MLKGGTYGWNSTGYNGTNGADLFNLIKDDLTSFIEEKTGYTLEGIAIGSTQVAALRATYPTFQDMTTGVATFMAVFSGNGGVGYKRIMLGVTWDTKFYMWIWGQAYANDSWMRLQREPNASDGAASIVITPPYTISVNNATPHTCPAPSAEYRDIRIVVAPINVTRTLTWDGETSETLGVGSSELRRSGVTVGVARTVDISAVGYETTQITCGLGQGDEQYNVRLVPDESATNRITVVTNHDATVTVQEAATFGDHSTLGEAEFTGLGPVAIDLVRAKIWYITATRDYTRGRWIDVGDVVELIDLSMSTTNDPAPPEPNEDIPAPTPGRMMLRCNVQCPGTLCYDNAGFLDEVGPIVISTPGAYDYEIPPPQIGCNGGTMLFTCDEGDFQREVTFIEDGTAELGMGPARVQLSSARSAQVFWDAESIFTWLPGDGELVATVGPGHMCEFLVSSSGYVNVAIIGTDAVIRFPVEFRNGALICLDATPGLTDDSTGDHGNPITVGTVGAAVVGLVIGVLIGQLAG